MICSWSMSQLHIIKPIYDLLFYCPWLSDTRNRGKCKTFTYVDQILHDYGHSKANGNVSNTTCLSYIDSIKRVLANKSMWSQICNKHCKDLCPFTYQKIEAQKKKRNEAQQSRTLTSKQSITNDNNKDHSRKGSRTKS